MRGRPVPIVVPHVDHKFRLDIGALESILLKSNIQDTNVVVISIVGAFRKGKSFILDFFLRYLNAQGSQDWMGNDDTPLEGFSWRGGSQRDTSGILVWSEVFVRRLPPSGEQVAIMLMDTQGMFDNQTTTGENVRIFTLSMLMSSLQIYNLSNNIQEDDLQNLQLCTEYGRLAQNDRGGKPLQELLFLIRDWSYPYEFQYGANGGQRKLKQCLEVTEDLGPELKSIRNNIRSCFKNISCFLMPHPGMKVASDPNFRGELSGIDGKFKCHLKDLVPLVLNPRNLAVKMIQSQKVKAKDFIEYFKSYFHILNGEELPEPKSILAATVEVNTLRAFTVGKDFYLAEMRKLCGGNDPVDFMELLNKHEHLKEQAISQFRRDTIFGKDLFSKQYQDNLETELDNIHSTFQQSNERKHVEKMQRQREQEELMMAAGIVGAGLGILFQIARLLF